MAIPTKGNAKKEYDAKAKSDNIKIVVGIVLVSLAYIAFGISAPAEPKPVKEYPPMDFNVYAVPLDTYGQVMGKLKGNLGVVNEMVGFVKSNGYRCDTISEAREAIGGGKLFLKCNNFRYHYEIVDRGGKIEVNVAN